MIWGEGEIGSECCRSSKDVWLKSRRLAEGRGRVMLESKVPKVIVGSSCRGNEVDF